jgi:anthranilate synthase component 1
MPSIAPLTAEEFALYAQQGFTHIALHRQVLADMETPLSTYVRLANAPYSFLFESVEGGERWGRYSIIGLPCHQHIRVHQQQVTYYQNNKITQQHTVADPLAALQQFAQQFRCPEQPGLPRFHGGLVGYFGYDSIGYFEPKLRALLEKPDALLLPDILLMVADELVVFDNLSGTATLIVHANPSHANAYDHATQRLDALAQAFQQPHQPLGSLALHQPAAQFFAQCTHTTGQAEYQRFVDQIKSYIAAGDVMQVVPSQRMQVEYTLPPLQLYRALRYLNPSPYLFYMHFDDFFIVGSSPEILVRTDATHPPRVTVRPIAGTRKRGATSAEDARLAQELLNDPKEIAEHVMLMDLGRNDVGRIAKTGSVRVTQDRVIERYSHVMHIVSNVEAELLPNLSPFDVLRATFPAGTLTGAPKIRAMQIIAELEPVKRNIYGGAVGYIGWNGAVDFAIAIRTAVIKDQILSVQAGAGIVTDSEPESEWQETLSKSRAVFSAADLSRQFIDKS